MSLIQTKQKQNKFMAESNDVVTIVITSDAPPSHIYQRAKETFGEKVNFEKGTVFTYGNKIHIFNKDHLANDIPLFHHESVHCRQQMKMGADEWWEKYFTDKDFRLSQELEAYTRQVKSIKKNIKDRNRRAMYLNAIAKDLSGSMYGNIISLEEVRKIFSKI